jgi:prevent-host-death family protein
MPEGPRRVSVRELKAHTSQVLREVRETGVEYVVSSRGRSIARIEPLDVTEASATTDGMGNSRGSVAGLPQIDWDGFVWVKSVWEPAIADDA